MREEERFARTKLQAISQTRRYEMSTLTNEQYFRESFFLLIEAGGEGPTTTAGDDGETVNENHKFFFRPGNVSLINSHERRRVFATPRNTTSL